MRVEKRGVCHISTAVSLRRRPSTACGLRR